MKAHRWPLLAILLVTGCVFARLVFAAGGVPFRVIPWDFRMACAPWLIYGWDMIRAGHWPLWCPYAGAGMPFFINPQTHTYSPLAIVVGLLVGQSVRLVQMQEVATIALAGIGAYGLSHAIWKSRLAAFLSGITFALSSSLFSHLEHFPILSAYAWAPWLLWAIYRTIEERARWGNVAIAAVTFALLTSGYLGVVLMLIPWAFAFAVALTLRATPERRERLRLLGGIAVAAGVGTAMAAVNWLPFLASSSEYTRGETLGIDYVLDATRSLAPKHVWGMLYSFITSTPFPGTEVDVSMRGVYFGAVTVVLATACLVWVRRWMVGALATLAIGSLLMAFGGAFFLRTALHMAVPIFNMSRFPAADSRYLAVLAFCVLAGGGALAITTAEHAPEYLRRAFKYLIVFYAVSVVALQYLYGRPIDIVLSTVTFEAVCMLLAFIIVKRWQNATAIALLSGIAILEIGFCVTANFAPAGEVMKKEDYLAFSHHVPGFPKDGILAPRLGNENRLNDDTAAAYIGKKFFITDYNPLRLKRLVTLTGAGFGPWLKSGPRVVAVPAGAAPDTFAAFAPLVRPVPFAITGFGPNHIDYEVDVDRESRLVFNEIYFPGWRATLDGKAIPVQAFAGALRSLDVPAGHHALAFRFRPTLFFVALAMSLVGVIVFAAWMVRVWRRRGLGAEKPAAA